MQKRSQAIAGSTTSGNEMHWKSLGMFIEQQPMPLAGMDLWKENWRGTGERVSLPHPEYPKQLHDFPVYETGIISNPIRFACSEMSPGGYALYVPKPKFHLFSK
jgi:hypothetical protein